MYVYIYIYVYICIYVNMYTYMYVCMYVHIYMSTYLWYIPSIFLHMQTKSTMYIYTCGQRVGRGLHILSIFIYIYTYIDIDIDIWYEGQERAGALLQPVYYSQFTTARYYVYTNVHLNIYVHMYTYIYIRIYTYIHTYTCIDIYIYIHICVYAYICIYIHVKYIHTHIHESKRKNSLAIAGLSRNYWGSFAKQGSFSTET